MEPLAPAILADALEAHYRAVNRRRYVHPDPLELLYDYDDPADREVVGLLASSLAYGRVAQILRSARRVLEPMGPHPARWLARTTPRRLRRTFATFRHRFTTGAELADLLAAVRAVRKRYGSLEACLARHVAPGDETVLPALTAFARRLRGPGAPGSLLPDPARRSACKRLHLFLRWMVRRDRVDPGGWRSVPARLLVVPLDTHMHAIGRALGFTRRRAAGRAAALEITRAFRALRPDDPVRYDFCLTRLGIHPAVRPCEFLLRLAST